MKKTFLFLLMLCFTAGAFAQTTKAKTLKIYRAKVNISVPYRERFMRGERQKFKKGEVITESCAKRYTIKSYNQANYLYGGSCDSDYTSSFIPKSSVSVESYQTGDFPVSVVGNGRTFSNGGTEYNVFIAKRNGHRFHANDYDTESAEVFNSSEQFCVITTNDEYIYTEYLLPIKNGIIQIPNLLKNTWVNFNCDDSYPDYRAHSFNSRKELTNDMYPNCDKPEFWESVCYIPSKNALYVGKGIFLPF